MWSSGQSQLILWGLVLGLACGLLLGEFCRPLLLVGEAYVKLLQMTVMPMIRSPAPPPGGRPKHDQFAGLSSVTARA